MTFQLTGFIMRPWVAGMVVAGMMTPWPTINAEEFTEAERKELLDLPRTYRAAQGPAEKLKVLQRSKELGDKGMARLRPIVTAPVKKMSAKYGPLFQAAAAAAATEAARTDKPVTLELVMASAPKLQAMRQELSDLIELADVLAPPSFSEQLQESEKKTIETFEQLRRMHSLDKDERQLVELINQARKQNKLRPLQVDPRLCQTAKSHSADMQQEGFFSHESPLPGKRSFADRARLFGTSASAENIAQAPTGQRTYDAWMKSPGHRQNILRKSTRLGVGRAGKYFTAVFGN